MLMDKTSVMIITLWQIATLWDAEGNDKQCCAQPDIQLIANVITNEFVLLKWSTSLDETYGFCVLYQCDADNSVNYCQETEYCFWPDEYDHDQATQTYAGRLPVAISSNSSCCFWVESVKYRYEDQGCSKLFCYESVMPNITIPEAEETYAITAGGSITCTAIGYPEPDVEWMSNDGSVVDENTLVTKNIVTASSGNLYNVSVSMTISRNDAGNYTCVANNSVGDDIITITVTVPSPPIITMPDSKQACKIIDGDSITCTATGNPVPDIVWLNSDGSEIDESRLVTNITMDTDINNVPSASVSMTVGWSDDGSYTCLANNSIGSNASTVHIIVQLIPNIMMPKAGVTYTITEGGSITCTATGYPVPDIVWLNSDGSEVDESRLVTNNTMDTDISNIPSVSVSMTLRSSDGGNYTCRANNSIGNDISTVHIIVNAKPSIIIPEAGETYTIIEGGSITCTAIGYPKPDVEWMNNNERTVDENTLVTKNIMTTTGSLFIVSVSMRVSRNDAGNYTCVANNSVGNNISIITVVVQSAPIIITPDSKQSYKVTNGDSITCTATGNPVPDIVWVNSDGSEIDESRLVTNSTMDTDISNIPSVNVSMTIRWSDDGNYTCRANNSIGSYTNTVHIIVQPPLSSPSPTQSSISPEPETAEDSSRIYIILFCVMFIIVALLLIIYISLFWWKKSKRKNTELEFTIKSQIERYLEDTDELSKDWCSDVEEVAYNKEHNDTVSTIEDDALGMLEMISHKRQTSLLSIISIINNEEYDVGIGDISESATTHYCNGGSAGSQSYISGQRASCTSATPLSNDT